MDSNNETTGCDEDCSDGLREDLEDASECKNSDVGSKESEAAKAAIDSNQLGAEKEVQNDAICNYVEILHSSKEESDTDIQCNDPKVIETSEIATAMLTTEINSEEISSSSSPVQKSNDDQLTNSSTELPVAQNENKITSISTPTSPGAQAIRYSDLTAPAQEKEVLLHLHCLAQQEQQAKLHEQQVESLRAALTQKENTIALYQRENAILEKEKQAFRKEKELANKEKETTVIKFAMKEKLLIDAKKEKESIEKQLVEAKKEIKNVSTRFQAVNEEKSRITYMVDEKCNEVRKYQRECEKLKSEISQLESRLKYHVNKLNIEVEAKAALEKKLDEERNAPNKLEEKANEKLKVEYEANTILLKHEITSKSEALERMAQENQKLVDLSKTLKQELSEMKTENTRLSAELEKSTEERNSVENAYSEEMLNSAKLRGQLEELQVLRTQNTLNKEEMEILRNRVKDLEGTVQDNSQDLQQLHTKEQELLSINKEMSESIVELQNEICLLKSKAHGIEAENKLLRQEKLGFDNKYENLEKQLSREHAEKNEERQLLAKHLSEKTKLYEATKLKLENVLGDFEATNHKHATVVKELQRELQKYKKLSTQAHSSPRVSYCSKCECSLNSSNAALGFSALQEKDASGLLQTNSHNGSSRESLQSSSRRVSETSESETVASGTTAVQMSDLQAGPTKMLVDRILRLQQASARQTEKIDFLENHTLSLVAELQKKSKVVQYYMMRDQTAGALTSSKSDQNKSELAKYGNGVMAAIYGGINKSENKSMTLDLSLEINKKLQAVLEDTLLKNITLKENLDVLGLEVDNLTRKLRQIEAAK